MTDEAPGDPFLFRLNVEPTPSPNDPKGVAEFYKALGTLIVAWGRLEGHLVVCLLTIINLKGGEALGRQLPMPWDKRAEMWRGAFEKIPQLQELKNSAMKLLSDIEAVASDRNALVHAIWEPFNAGEPPTVEIVKIKPKKRTDDGLEIARANIGVDTLEKIASKINRINLALIPISDALTQIRRAQKPTPANIRIV